uniref:Vesicle associated membrane protein 7 n=1 Tax=Ovis aries TaxID=9940 RepID=A0AC11EGT1_SHEEP
MAILFAVVARGTTILAKHAWCGGNFLEVTEQILAKIPSENNKLTYSHGNYLFHYICQDRIVYLCITDDDFERSRAFNFLNEIKKRFQTTYGSRAQTALPYAMNSEFSSVLAAQLKHHSENKGLDKVMETQAQVDELKGIMVRNIDLVAQRGERLELLIDKTENLVDSAPLSMGFPRQEYWSGLPFPFPGDIPDPRIKLVSPALVSRYFTTEPLGKPP